VPSLERQPAPGLAEVSAFLAHFRGAFARADQARWAAVYLCGLLTPGDRKTIEHAARAMAGRVGREPDSVAQALQHFLDRSPWDEERLLRSLRAALLPRRAAEGCLVLCEMAFPKQGRHSVGVQRQYSSSFDRKINCQVAFALLHAGPAGCFPLALRLYLPRAWQQDPARLDAAGVPPAARKHQTRSGLAVALLGSLAGESLPERTIVGPAEDLTTAAKRAGLRCLCRLPADATEALNRCLEELRSLGLGHFEGRSWRGFHHHTSLVLLAHALGRLDGVNPSNGFSTGQYPTP
jgi:SRSO17 transposase